MACDKFEISFIVTCVCMLCLGLIGGHLCVPVQNARVFRRHRCLYVVTDGHVLSCLGGFYFGYSMVSFLIMFLFCCSLLA
jgi:hypothetical protein